MTRDLALEEWSFAEKMDVSRTVGSGYPGGALLGASERGWTARRSPCAWAVVFADRPAPSRPPADEVTKTWLKQHIDPVFGFPSLVRFSWKTCETILKEKGVPVEWWAARRTLLAASEFIAGTR